MTTKTKTSKKVLTRDALVAFHTAALQGVPIITTFLFTPSILNILVAISVARFRPITLVFFESQIEKENTLVKQVAEVLASNPFLHPVTLEFVKQKHSPTGNTYSGGIKTIPDAMRFAADVLSYETEYRQKFSNPLMERTYYGLGNKNWLPEIANNGVSVHFFDIDNLLTAFYDELYGFQVEHGEGVVESDLYELLGLYSKDLQRKVAAFHSYKLNKR